MYVLKDLSREEKSKAQLDGTAVHDALRQRLKLNEPLPDEHAAYEPLCAQILSKPPSRTLYVEQKLGMTKDGGTCGFFHSDAWLRGTADVALVETSTGQAWLGDWKTGKEREDPTELAVQALLLKTAHPGLKKITGNYIWLRNLRAGATHDVSDTDRTLKKVRDLEASIDRRLVNNDWPADEGPLCSFCPVTSQMCEFKR